MQYPVCEERHLCYSSLPSQVLNFKNYFTVYDARLLFLHVEFSSPALETQS